MSQPPLLNPEPKQIGSYVVRFVGNELHIALATEPEQALVRLEGETALELIDWLGLSRPQLFLTVMRDGLETFKAQVRAEFHLPEPAEPEPRAIYISPGSVDETLIALTRAAAVTPVCNGFAPTVITATIGVVAIITPAIARRKTTIEAGQNKGLSIHPRHP